MEDCLLHYNRWQGFGAPDTGYDLLRLKWDDLQEVLHHTWDSWSQTLVLAEESLH